jgi:hypothetical protein
MKIVSDPWPNERPMEALSPANKCIDRQMMTLG